MLAAGCSLIPFRSLAKEDPLAQSRQAEEAAELLTAALTASPGDANLMARLGFAKLRLGDRAGAADLAQAALELDARSPRARRLLSRLLLRGDFYLHILAHLHASLEPATYVEIGVFKGESLRLAQPTTTAIGVDPDPKVAGALPEHIRVVEEASDDFFARHDVRAELGGRAVELAFIDGMHHCEFALRDFMNLEACCAESALILLHDCYLLDAVSSAREPSPDIWTGDVWRTVIALRRHRPDLDIVTLDCPPSGLGLIRRLDPNSRLLANGYAQIVEEMLAYDFDAFAPDRDRELNLSDGSLKGVTRLLGREG